MTITSPANQLRLLQQNFANLARTIGNLFLPVLSKILPVVNGIVIALQRLFSWVGGLLGIKFDTINSAMGGMSDSTADLVGGTDDYENSLEDANKAAKKLKSTVLGIDELNINAPDESGGGAANKPTGGGGGGIPELDTAIADALAAYEKIWNDAFDRMENKAQEFADSIEKWFQKAWKAIEPFRESLKRLWDEGLSKLANFTWTALKDFYNEFLVPMGMWAFGTEGQGLTRLVDIINNSLMKINWEALNTSLKNFWIAIEPYAEQFGEGLIDFFEDVSNFAVGIINAFPGLLDKITGALNKGDPTKARDWGYALGVFATGLLALKGLGVIVSGIFSIGTSVAGLTTAFSGLATIGSSIAAFFAPVTVLFSNLGQVFALTAGGAGTLTEAFSAIFGVSLPVVAAVAAVALSLIDLWKTSELFKNSVKVSFVIIGDSVANAFKKIIDAISPLWEKIKELGNSLYELYEITLKPLVEILFSFTAILVGIASSAAIEIIGSAITGLIEILGGAVDILSGFVNIVIGILTLDFSKIGEGFGKIGEGISELVGGIEEITIGWIDGFWNNLWGKFGEPIENAIISIQNWWNSTAIPFFQEMPERIGEIINSIAAWFDELPGKIGYAIGYTIGTITSWAEQLKAYLAEKVPEIIESVKTWFAELPGKIYDSIILFKDSIILWVSEIISTAKIEVPKIIKKIKEFFDELPEKIFEIGKNIISGLFNGMGEAWDSLKDGISTFVDGVMEGFRSGFDIHSPSKKMEEIGQYLLQGLDVAFGNESTSDSIIEFTNNIINLFTEQLGYDRFYLIGQNMTLGLKTAWQELITWWNEESMPLWFEEGVMPWFSAEKWMETTDGMKLGITNKWTEFTVLWKTNFTKWWTADIEPWFSIAKWNFFGENMKNGLFKGFEGITSSVAGILNKLINSFESAMNQIVRAVNDFVSDYNGMAKVLGTDTLSKFGNFSFENIPKFADGGIVNRPTFSMIGENGAEAIVPLKNNTEWINNVSAGILENMGNSRSDDLIREEIELLKEQNQLLMAIADKEMVAVMDSRETLGALRQQAKREGFQFST